MQFPVWIAFPTQGFPPFLDFISLVRCQVLVPSPQDFEHALVFAQFDHLQSIATAGHELVLQFNLEKYSHTQKISLNC